MSGTLNLAKKFLLVQVTFEIITPVDFTLPWPDDFARQGGAPTVKVSKFKLRSRA